MEKLSHVTENIIDENVERLAELFPEVVTEVREPDGSLRHTIDVDALKERVGDVADGQRERYQFTWPGKREAKQEAYRQIDKCLRPCPEESVNWDTTQNLYIEGDNLDALKLLRNTYAGKVKMIYIDPPYNTGHDFIYDDDFAQTKADYDAESGDYDEDGGRLVANPESNGRFHSDWCSMMYPRLLLARDLLSEDGLLFISMGDEEINTLIDICVEIFGMSNFRNSIVVRRGAKSVQAQFETCERLGKDFEYVLLFSKKADYRFPTQFKKLASCKKGAWNNHWRGSNRPTMRYELFGITPTSGQWRWSEERSQRAIENYRCLLKDMGTDNPSDEQIDDWYHKKGNNCDLLRLSKSGKPEHYIPPTDMTLLNSSWTDLLVGSSSEIAGLFDSRVFDTAKLTRLITRMMRFCERDALILDFFSGSATTAHAVMQLNAENGGNRKFIMVQLPEVCDEKSEAAKAGYKNICEIGKERIRRAGRKIAAEVEESNRQLKLGEEPKKVPDIGFRVLKIDSSNFEDVTAEPAEYTQQTLAGLADNLKLGRTAEDLLFQVMPQFQIPLSAKIEKRDVNGSSVFSVDEGRLVACFDRNVATEAIVAMAKLQPDYAVMRDASFTGDDAVSNFGELFKTYSPATITRVV